jgi:Zn-dependent protease
MPISNDPFFRPYDDPADDRRRFDDERDTESLFDASDSGETADAAASERTATFDDAGEPVFDEPEEEFDPLVVETLHELDKLHDKQKVGTLGGLFLLGLSLLVFAAAGVFSWEPVDLVLLVVVLLIHETGHYVGMRYYGYQNVQMFFIPFFGAAVSGRTVNVPAYQQAIVFLLGPVPGILIGLGLALLNILDVLPASEIASSAARMFLLINVFNLLPIFPLDGGQLVNLLLFCRNRYAEAIFRGLAGLVLLGGGWAMGAWLLMGLGGLMLLSTNYTFGISSLALEFRRRLNPDRVAAVATASIPRDLAVPIIQAVRERMPGLTAAQPIARSTHNVWEKLRTRPPGVVATFLLLLAYGGSFCLAPVVLAMVILADTGLEEPTRQIVAVPGPDGRMVTREETHQWGHLLTVDEVSEDGLYHGAHITYHFASSDVAVCGMWKNGRWDGTWTYYEPDGRIIKQITYDEGRFVSYIKPDKPESLIEKIEDLAEAEQMELKLHNQLAPHGPQQNE